jgi:hypothetical protein
MVWVAHCGHDGYFGQGSHDKNCVHALGGQLIHHGVQPLDAFNGFPRRLGDGLAEILRRQPHRDGLDRAARVHLQEVGRQVTKALVVAEEILLVSLDEPGDFYSDGGFRVPGGDGREDGVLGQGLELGFWFDNFGHGVNR